MKCVYHSCDNQCHTLMMSFLKISMFQSMKASVSPWGLSVSVKALAIGHYLPRMDKARQFESILQASRFNML